MLKVIKKLGFLSLMFLGTLSTLHANEKIYIDSEEMHTDHGHIRIHTGHNVWIETDAIHSDNSGIFTLESNITRLPNMKAVHAEYEKSWKCPYCYQYWPIGRPCQNAACPSKYK